MSIKYCVSIFSRGKIVPVEIDRETCAFIWTKGEKRRTSKKSTHEIYFDTWEEAYAHEYKRAVNNVASLERRLKLAQEVLYKVESLVDPSKT